MSEQITLSEIRTGRLETTSRDHYGQRRLQRENAGTVLDGEVASNLEVERRRETAVPPSLPVFAEEGYERAGL